MSAAYEAIKAKFDKYVFSNYRRQPLCIVRGAGSLVWDETGREYLDLFPGWGVAGLGHCHPRIAAAVARQAQKLIHVANTLYFEEQANFAEALSTRADGQKVFFCNSGAEAAEGAIKLARLHCQPKYKIITMKDSFHGRTFAAISATGQPDYRKGFAPTVPGFSHATFNDLDSVKALVDDETCAIMLEPVQGEGGVNAATPEFLQGLRKLCDEKKMLLIFDEVQTTPARLGTWFGYQSFGVVPDILTSAKAIAGGMPLGIFMAKAEISDSLIPGTHASTFGGNSIGCAAGLEAIKVIEDEKLMDNIRKQGLYIDQRIQGLAAKTGQVNEARRKGFMVGIDLNIPGADIVTKCREAGVLLNCTHDHILRVLPAFNITENELARGFDVLEQVMTGKA